MGALPNIVGTVWRHYKGQHYKVLAVGRIEGSHEAVVVYQALYDDFAVWVRPLDEWYARVNVHPGTVGEARFEQLAGKVL